MTHRKTTVVMIGVCMLWLAVASSAMANEFYAEGQADTIEGAENLGKTIVHYATVLGFPLLSAGLLTGGLLKMRRDPGLGGGLLASGGAAGYIGSIVNNLHSDAAAASFASFAGGQSWPAFAVCVVLQAVLLASLLCYARRKLPCGSAAGAFLTSR